MYGESTGIELKEYYGNSNGNTEENLYVAFK